MDFGTKEHLEQQHLAPPATEIVSRSLSEQEKINEGKDITH